MRPRICVPIGKETSEEIIKTIHSLDLSYIDLIEIRADYLKDWSGISRIPALVEIPTILTYKTTKQSEDRSKDELKKRIKSAEGFTYFDLDLSMKGLREQAATLKDLNIKPIISFHNASETPSLRTLKSVIHQESDAGAEICKLVTTAKKPEDNLTCLKLIKELSPSHKIVCFAMGHLGATSRVMSPLFGAFFTFASIDKGEETAPGQLTVKEMRQMYRILGVDGW